MNRSFLSMLLLAGACVVPGGCSFSADKVSPPSAGMPQLRALPINVRAVTTRMEGTRTEGRFVVDPLIALENYLHARFRAQGSADSLNVVIEDASVSKTEQASDVKMARFLDVGGMDVYNIVLKLRLEHVSEDGQILYGKGLSARRTIHISEHASISQRERDEREALQTLLAQLDQEIAHIVTEDMRLGSDIFGR